MSSSPSYDEQRLRESFAGYERGANTFEPELVASDRCAGTALSAAALARAINR